jgi:NAD(P)-dependent dehydrogenase (short-subunit alcohol dehydrogenase family)
MGMGLATARAFAQSGASVVLADRDGDPAKQCSGHGVQ